MWKKLFSWRDFWPFPICLVMGVLFLLAGKEGSPLKLLLGIASLAYTLYDLAKQLISRISILRSPDYPAMERDLSDARSFLGGRILLGKDWLFSSYSGKIYPCKAVRDLQQKVSRPPRGSATAKLRARVPGEGEVVLAAYDYEEENIRQANALARALERRQAPAQAHGAEATAPPPSDSPQAQAAPERQEVSAGRKVDASPEEIAQGSLSPDDTQPLGKTQGPEARPQEQTDTAAHGNGERFEDYVCTLKTPLGVYLFTVFLFSMFPLFIAVSCCVIAGRAWLAVPISVVLFFLVYVKLKRNDRSRESSNRERILERFNVSEMQTDFEQALRNSSDTVRLGKQALFIRGHGLPIRFESILQVQNASVGDTQAIRMDVYRDGSLKTIDLPFSKLCFSLPDGRTLSPDDFIDFLRERHPQIQLGVPVID